MVHNVDGGWVIYHDMIRSMLNNNHHGDEAHNSVAECCVGAQKQKTHIKPCTHINTDISI